MAISDFSQLVEKVGFRIATVSGQFRLKNLTGDFKIAEFADMAGQLAASQLADAAVSTSAKLVDGIISTAKLIDANVTYAKVQNAAALSILGRAANTVGVLADIVAANDGEVLRRAGTALGFGQIATAGIASGAVTADKQTALSRSVALSGTSVAAGSALTLTADKTVGSWAAISSNAQAVPEAGTYEITCQARMSFASATNPSVGFIDLYVNGSVYATFAATVAAGARFSAGTSDTVWLSGNPLIVTLAANDAISFRPAGQTMTSIGSQSRANIRKIAA